ncbi:CRISPR-associated protein Cas3 [Pseudoalteromonas luteoviolacea]|nr:CRISPR-associated protein Cas3 [Pseudoalteromonas luteoviolacea]
MSDLKSEIFQFWGKADEHNTLPAVCHMLDVAFVARAIINQLAEQERSTLIGPFLSIEGVDEKAAISIVVLLIALHDVGKITPGFQYKLPVERIDKLFNINHFSNCEGAETKHGTAGFVILHDYLCDKYAVNKNAARVMISAVASHHGVFVANKGQSGPCGNHYWNQVQVTAIEWLASYLSVDLHLLTDLHSKALTPTWFSYTAGLCSVADWVGSDKSHFCYCEAQEYVFEQRQRKANALADKLNIKHILASNNPFKFADVFTFKPNALQQKVLNIIESKALPWITIIESGMGSGKTEAAQILADHFIRQAGHSGLYVAMPSQATANQLYKRMLKFLQHEALGYQNVETHLKHSNADFEPNYEALRLNSIDLSSAQDNSHSVTANQWFTSKKHGLLAGVCVGTIDQLLMAAMLYKHNFVRLFGLANKVLILDEVHSLQSFQLDLLKNTLHWMAKLKVRVIILSATLPRTMLVELVKAYGQTVTKEVEVENKPYPRVTTYSSGALAQSHTITDDKEPYEKECVSRPPSQYEIKLHATSPSQCVSTMAGDVLAATKKAGTGVFVCILNTVSKVQELSKLIAHHCAEAPHGGIELLTFHARYPLATRLSIEKMIEHLVGKHPEDHNGINPNRPVKDKCLILIGSQVLEQSLDYDACEMFTQIAPIDLLLQRVGRVWRHQVNNPVRSEFTQVPRLNVYLPSMDKIPNDYGDWFGHGEVLIYPSHILAVTTRLLWENTNVEGSAFEIDINRDMDNWINRVYADVEQQVTWLEQEYDKAFEFRLDKRTQFTLAKNMMFDADKKSVRDLLKYNNSEIDHDEVALSTRLTSISVQLIFLVVEDGSVIPVTEFSTYKQGVQGAEFPLSKCKQELEYEIDWQGKQCLQKSDIARLKQSMISISHSKWVAHFKELEAQWLYSFVAKSVWQRSPTLFNCIPVILDTSLVYQVEGLGELKLDSKLGLIVGKGGNIE